MIPAAYALAGTLIAALDEEVSLTEQHKDATVVPYELVAMRKRIRILTADLKAALATPVQDVSKPYCRWGK